MKTHKILYIGNFNFPHGNAAGSRVLANGHLFKEIGHEVLFLGLSKDTDIFDENTKFHDGFAYSALPYPKNLLDWVSIRSKRRTVINYLEKNKPSIVVFYGNIGNSILTLLLARWCRNNGIVVVHDVVDWLPSTSKSHLRKVLKFADTEFHKRYVNLVGDGVIAISSYLQRYYAGRGKTVVVIPPLSSNCIKNSDATRFKKKLKQKGLSFIYAGYPFDAEGGSADVTKFKDRLDVAIDIFSCSELEDSKFHIYGISKNSYLSIVSRHESLLLQNDCDIYFYGQIDNSLLRKKIAESDFVFLYRDKNIGTDAGFPSKIVESINMGTAVITTATSDLCTYVGNGKNGYILGFDHNDAMLEFRNIFSSTSKNQSDLEVDQCTFSLGQFKEEASTFITSLER